VRFFLFPPKKFISEDGPVLRLNSDEFYFRLQYTDTTLQQPLLTEQLKFKLDNRCSNNQVEQLAIVKALEAIEKQQVNHTEHRTAVIYTDSKITMDSIRRTKNHNHLVEEIRKRSVTLYKKNWKIEFKFYILLTVHHVMILGK
jgi:ribonuclease HI